MRVTNSGQPVKQVSARIRLTDHKLLASYAASRGLRLGDVVAASLAPLLGRLRKKTEVNSFFRILRRTRGE